MSRIQIQIAPCISICSGRNLPVWHHLIGFRKTLFPHQIYIVLAYNVMWLPGEKMKVLNTEALRSIVAQNVSNAWGERQALSTNLIFLKLISRQTGSKDISYVAIWNFKLELEYHLLTTRVKLECYLTSIFELFYQLVNKLGEGLKGYAIVTGRFKYLRSVKKTWRSLWCLRHAICRGLSMTSKEKIAVTIGSPENATGEFGSGLTHSVECAFHPTATCVEFLFAPAETSILVLNYIKTKK